MVRFDRRFRVKYVFIALTLCLLVILHALLSSADFFQSHFLSKNSFRNTITVPNCLDPDQSDVFTVMIWFQTVCKVYQRTKVVGKELINFII